MHKQGAKKFHQNSALPASARLLTLANEGAVAEASEATCMYIYIYVCMYVLVKSLLRGMLPVHKLDTRGHVASPACSVYGCSGWATNLCIVHAWLFQCVHVTCSLHCACYR